jgi:ribitol 2-dehydrogenase
MTGGGAGRESVLAGKVVIITGASSGIGAATARMLAGLDCRLVLAARSGERLEALQREIGPAALAVPTDITSGPDVRRLVERAREKFGRIDVLFANAGLYIAGQFAEGDPDGFARLIDVNVTGVLRCVHAVTSVMKGQHSGDIVVTSSISGQQDIVWEPVYSASKHAVQALVHTLRRQLAAHGIRVSSVAPGMVANELWGITQPADIEGHISARTAVRSEDVAEAVVFILTRPAHIAIRDLVMLPQNQDL